MKVRYYIDPETEQPHIYNHGVSEDEIEDVLRKPGEDRPDSIFVITAYDLSGKSLKAYRRRRRRKLK